LNTKFITTKLHESCNGIVPIKLFSWRSQLPSISMNLFLKTLGHN
jgi:hypothetical protein